MTRPDRIWTVGHSALPPAEFLDLLETHRIELAADVRRFPVSRRHPHFSGVRLEADLAQAGIGYLHLPALGGRRQPVPGSANTGWRDEAFRGYADHMETQVFAQGLQRLLAAAATRRTVILCAEKAWQDCHRGLIADLLKASAITVIHILGPLRSEVHPYTRPARIADGQLSYSAAPSPQGRLDI